MKIEDYSNIKINNISEARFSPMEIYELTNQLLTDYYLTFGHAEGEAVVPIEKIANWLGFKIASKDINFYNKSAFNIARLNGNEKVIYVATDAFAILSNKRFAVAKMLGYYISEKSSKCSNEFKLRLDEAKYAAEIFASFILVPPVELLKFMSNYHEANRKRYIDSEKYLSEASAFYKIPFIQMVVAFEHIKTLFINIGSKNKEEDLGDRSFSDLKRALKNSVPNFLYY